MTSPKGTTNTTPRYCHRTDNHPPHVDGNFRCPGEQLAHPMNTDPFAGTDDQTNDAAGVDVTPAPHPAPGVPHAGDTVQLTATAANIADNVDGHEGHITTITTRGHVVQCADFVVSVSDPADLTVIDCPHQEN